MNLKDYQELMRETKELIRVLGKGNGSSSGIRRESVGVPWPLTMTSARKIAAF